MFFELVAKVGFVGIPHFLRYDVYFAVWAAQKLFCPFHSVFCQIVENGFGSLRLEYPVGIAGAEVDECGNSFCRQGFAIPLMDDGFDLLDDGGLRIGAVVEILDAGAQDVGESLPYVLDGLIAV